MTSFRLVSANWSDLIWCLRKSISLSTMRRISESLSKSKCKRKNSIKYPRTLVPCLEAEKKEAQWCLELMTLRYRHLMVRIRILPWTYQVLRSWSSGSRQCQFLLMRMIKRIVFSNQSFGEDWKLCTSYFKNCCEFDCTTPNCSGLHWLCFYLFFVKLLVSLVRFVCYPWYWLET